MNSGVGGRCEHLSGFSDHCRLRRVQLFRAEIQPKIGICSREAGVTRNVAVTGPREASETGLNQLLRRQLEPLRILAQILDARVGIALKPSAKRPQRFYDLGSDGADRSVGGRERIFVERDMTRQPSHSAKRIRLTSSPSRSCSTISASATPGSA